MSPQSPSSNIDNSVNSGNDVEVLEVQLNNDIQDGPGARDITEDHEQPREHFFSDVPFSTKSSAAWQRFKKGHGPKLGFAQCKHCLKVLKTSGGSTKGLISHLLSAHQIVMRITNNTTPKRKRVETSLNTFFAPSSKLEATETIIRLVCLDKFTILSAIN